MSDKYLEKLLSNHDWSFPVPIAYGPGRLETLGQQASALALTNPLIVTDKGSAELPFIQTLQQKVEHRLQVLRRWCRKKNVAVTEGDSRSQGQTERRGLPSATAGGQGHGVRQRFFGDHVHELQHGLSLIQRSAAGSW